MQAGTRPLSELALLDLDQMAWVTPPISGQPPSPRGQPTAVVTTPVEGRPQQLMVFGGWDGCWRYNDIHSLDLRVSGANLLQFKLQGMLRERHPGTVLLGSRTAQRAPGRYSVHMLPWLLS